MKDKTKTNSKMLICIFTIICSVLFTIHTSYQHKYSLLVAIISSLTLFLCGYIFRFIQQLPTQDESYNLEIPQKTAEQIRDSLQHYMEHPDIGESVVRALVYYDKALDVVKEGEGKIIIRHEDGEEEPFDPVSLEVFPESDEDDDFQTPLS